MKTKFYQSRESQQPKLPLAEIAKKVVDALNDKRGIYAVLEAGDAQAARVSFTYRGQTYLAQVSEAQAS